MSVPARRQAHHHLDRSRLRSRAGCTRCKQRHVRCDESRPICGHCARLKLNCIFEPVSHHRSRITPSSTPRSSSRVNVPTEGSVTFASPVGLLGSDKSAQENNGSPHNFRSMSSNTTFFEEPSCLRDEQQIPKPGQILFTASAEDGMASVFDQSIESQMFSSMACTGDPVDHSTMMSNMDVSLYSSDINAFYSIPYANLYPTFTFSDIESSPGLIGNGMSGFLSSSDGMEIPNIPPDIMMPGLQHLRDGDTQTNTFVSQYPKVAPPSGLTFLSENVSTFLLSFFNRSVRPPASLLSMDPVGWYQLRNHLMAIAFRSRAVKYALLAVAELYADQMSANNPWLQNRPFQNSHFEIQTMACQKLRAELDCSNENFDTQNVLLVAVFLLSWFEISCDDGGNGTRFPQDLAEKVITSKGAWGSDSKLILKCLNSIDAKAAHLGGRQLLSSASLDVIFQYRFEVENRVCDASDDDNEDECGLNDSINEISQSRAQSNQHRRRNSSFTRKRSILPNIIKMNVFNAILQPALEFHLVSQRYSRLISAYDRHNRRRDTAEDEFEVITACKTFETELKRLWKHRPRVLDMRHQELSEIVCQDIASRVETLFSVYIGTFWAHFLYLHRTAWWHLPLSTTAADAMDSLWSTMRRNISEPEEITVTGTGSTLDISKALHPGLMWPLFLFGCECRLLFQQQWSVAQLRAIGKSTSGMASPDESNEEAIPRPENSQKGAQNAIRAATLLEEMIRRRNETGIRVDGRDLSLEMFGCHFSII